ncbi:TraB/GumN family protein [Maribacter sp.]|nr:TraB/GumN family protein [Maribacter sp.]
MRYLITALFSFFIFTTAAQEANSLLWEISGNGLQESSYLYGTMHVSRRIAFRLDDVFYDALDKSEIVALESDPATWLDNDALSGLMGYGQGNGFYSKGFYQHLFAVKNPSKEEMAMYLAFNDSRVNGILYRSNSYSENFEEETYLDMFIYQAGKKFDKNVIALEDLEESSALVGRASMNPMKQKPDEWLQKKMQKQGFMVLLQDAYRDRNINMLDSIDKGMYTEHYLKNMLFTRNRNMANKLDSVVRTAKTFTGIGAAHLPGKEGVIQMLRDKGYSVKPLTSKATSKGKRLKEKLEKTLRENSYTPAGPEDDFFSVSMPNKLYPVSDAPSTSYISPDLANGSYVMVNRIPTYAHLKQEQLYTLDDLDKMLFENIPGKILEKAPIERNGFQGLDIKNQLKNGDHQRYHIFLTPLEIVIFKMGGDGDYVQQHSDTIFNSIAFKTPDQRMETITSGFDDFQVRMPSLHSFPNRLRNGDRMVQGYDQASGSYYFLRKVTVNDFSFIEQDTFELKQIQKRFYQDLKIQPSYDGFAANALVSRATIDSVSGKQLHLKTTFKRGDYYLLGVVTKKAALAADYFASFKIQPSIDKKSFEKVIDTAMFFSTVSTVKPRKFVENSSSYMTGRNRPKPYNAFNKKTIYQNKNNEAITIELNKSHDFMMFPSIDSVWNLRKKLYAYKRFNIIKEKDSSYADGHHELQLTLTDTASRRGVLIKNVLKGGLLYEIKAQVDTVDAPSRFVTEFFDNFTLLDTLIGKDILADRAPAFFEALRKNDSIVLNGYTYIDFKEKHVDSLKHYIANFKYPDDKKHLQAYLIQKLGKLKSPEVEPFLKSFYGKSYNNSNAQTKILQSVSCKSDENSVKLLLELLSQDLPLVSNTFEINRIFRPYRDSLELAKKLYPELLDYSAIEEYKSPVFSMLAKLQAKGLIKPKSYKKFRKQILNDAKIQLKRELGNEADARDLGYYAGLPNLSNDVLANYVVLLYPFREEKDVKQFFNRLQMLKDRQLKITYAMLVAKSGATVPKSTLNPLAKDINSRAMLYGRLKEIKKLELFPKEYKSARYLAESVLYAGGNFDKTKDTVHFLEKRALNFDGKACTGYYFKTHNKEDYDANFAMNLIVFDDAKGLTIQPFYEQKGQRIEDTDTDAEAMEYITEAFILKDRQRADIYRPNGYGAYGYHGY